MCAVECIHSNERISLPDITPTEREGGFGVDQATSDHKAFRIFLFSKVITANKHHDKTGYEFQLQVTALIERDF